MRERIKTQVKIACAFVLLLALGRLMSGCATFQRATDDVPGTVGVGLSISACVNAAFRDIPDTLAREREIAKCIHDAFNQLTAERRREVIAAIEAK